MDVLYSFFPMTTAPPDLDLSAPAILQAFAVAEAERVQAARGRARVGRWLRRLADIGIALAEGMNAVAMSRRAQGAQKVTDDLKLGWALVARALGWIDALRTRLAAEAAAAKAVMGPRESDFDGPEHLILRQRRPSEAAVVDTPPPAVCIKDKSTAEVVGQICVDLDAAASLLRDREAAAQIAAIALAARALLGAPAATWRPLLAPALPDDAADKPELVAVPVSPAPVSGPDTG